jgi:hypothetical protein
VYAARPSDRLPRNARRLGDREGFLMAVPLTRRERAAGKCPHGGRTIANARRSPTRSLTPPEDTAPGGRLPPAGRTEQQVAFYLFSSAEFSTLHASNSDFITALYNDVLGRQPAASEITFRSNELGSGLTRSDAIQAVLDSREGLSRSVNGFDSIFLARPSESLTVSLVEYRARPYNLPCSRHETRRRSRR